MIVNELPIPLFRDMEPIPILAVPPFVAGFVWGLAKEDKLLEIQACITGAEVLAPKLEFALNKVEEGGQNNDMQALMELGIVALQLPTVLVGCEHMTEDITAIKVWAQIFKDSAALKKKVTKNLVLHGIAIHADIKNAKQEWSDDEYYKAGITVADLLT